MNKRGEHVEKGPVMEKIEEEIAKGRIRDGANAGTTSPQDPNA